MQSKVYDVLVNGSAVFSGSSRASSSVYRALRQALSVLGVDAVITISFQP